MGYASALRSVSVAQLGTLLLHLLLLLPDGEASPYFNRLLAHSRIRGRSEGANTCAVQQIDGTSKRYFSSCKSWYQKKICGKPTTVNYECCPGFISIEGEKGCPAIAPLSNVFSTLETVDATATQEYSQRAELRGELDGHATVTYFAPQNEGWTELPTEVLDALVSNVNRELRNALYYHMVNRRLLASDLKHSSTLTSMYEKLGVMVHHYPNGIITVNCARLLKPNNLATNGVVHVIDRVIAPPSTNMRQILESDDNLATLRAAVAEAGLLDDLEKDGAVTFFAPTNEAFEKLPTEVLQRILSDPIALKALLNNHMVDSLQCSEAVLSNANLESLEGTPLTVGCDGDKLTLNGKAIVTKKDVLARNGVVHLIDDVLVPNSAKSVFELADSAGVTSFIDMFAEAGLKGSLKPGEAYTLLAPKNEAFTDTTIFELSDDIAELLKNHVIKGQVSLYQLYNGQELETLGGKKIRIFIYRKAICIENSCVSTMGKEGRLGILHVINKLIQVPVRSFLEILQADRRFSTLVELIKTAGLTEKLRSGGRLTLFAPTNEAFAALPKAELNRLKGNPKELEALLNFHLASEVLVSGGIVGGAKNVLRTLHGGLLEIESSKDGSFLVNGKKVVESDLMATSGAIHIINGVLTPTSATSNKFGLSKSSIASGSTHVGGRTKIIDGGSTLSKTGTTVTRTIVVDGDEGISEGTFSQLQSGGTRVSKINKVVKPSGQKKTTVKKTVTHADGTTSTQTFTLEGDDIEGQIRRLSQPSK
ncbi:LOW QUALITY PROTEIN: transforming growth factor-beta-induced protein ig-h3-like [Lethenteron reissneri]|uniref:LOW QUALITY PROTEIN: transforming growth factor-beta-induced protein ig-h3-like n=1 Tax=Lethenteron reissneri TaxID=7753 RepID=UPI002AB77DCE|nr:LOW QUALITY PROTEIN: transforming growth factor-beta-induced protein ig-h3-like [Lethenteron reissneri]